MESSESRSGTLETGSGAKGARAGFGGALGPSKPGFPGNLGFPGYPSGKLENAVFPVWGQTSATQRGPGIVKFPNSISRLKKWPKQLFFDFSGISGKSWYPHFSRFSWVPGTLGNHGFPTRPVWDGSDGTGETTPPPPPGGGYFLTVFQV